MDAIFGKKAKEAVLKFLKKNFHDVEPQRCGDDVLCYKVGSAEVSYGVLKEIADKLGTDDIAVIGFDAYSIIILIRK